MTVHGTNTARMLARGRKKKWYVPDERCTVCGSTGKRLVETNECSSCHPELLEEENYLTAKSWKKNFYYSTEKCEECEKTGDRWVTNRMCVKCFPNPESKRANAKTRGLKWYNPGERCKQCGIVADRRVSDNRCIGCYPVTDKTPRQIAMMRGQKWYRPKKPCPRCGLMVKKPTSNGKCPGCTLREETWIMIKNAPDMVISSDHARKLKLQVYRTGKPCRNGHTGFKMISTNDCIDCLKKGDI